MNDLIKRYEALLLAPITCENVLELAKVRQELAKSKEVRLAKVENERLDFLDGRKPWGDIYKSDGTIPGVEVNLVVLDKESIPEVKGFKKYSLAYALDSTRPQEGDNLVNGTEVLACEDFRAGSVLTVKVRGVQPAKSGKLYGVSITSAPLSLAVTKERVNSAKEILRKAFKVGVLELDKSTAVDLCKVGILSFNIDERFGVGLDKEVKFTKGAGFMQDGIVYGIVYPVNEVDSDGDYATSLEVQKACWRFMEDFQKFNYMHGEDLSARDVALVECACALADVPDLKIKKGDWYIAVKVYKMELRKKIESGEITGFSMEGSAQPGTPIEGMKR
jgi:hypothetical protein